MPMQSQQITEVPRVGVGVLVVRGDQLLMVQSQRGPWSTPGGHLDFGESPAECAIRETKEETGIDVSNVEFVAITNDLLPDAGRHYLTVWMRADADDSSIAVEDTCEVARAAWFRPDGLPTPLFLYFKNLISGRSLPESPGNLPFAEQLRRAATLLT